MSITRALATSRARAAVLIPAGGAVFLGLWFLGGAFVESGHRWLGDTISDVAWGCLLVAVFFGPAWVIRGAPGPRNDGPPRGGLLPFPTRTPAQDGARGAGDRRSDRAARAVLRTS